MTDLVHQNKFEAQEYIEKYKEFEKIMQFQKEQNPYLYNQLKNKFEDLYLESIFKKMGLKPENDQQQQNQNDRKKLYKQNRIQKQQQNQPKVQFLSLKPKFDKNQQMLFQKNEIDAHNKKFKKAQFVSLAKKQKQNDFNNKDDYLQENQVICQRYNKKITVVELKQLDNLNFLNENQFNFFIRYLEEKQSNLSQKKHILLLTTSFYKCLVKQKNKQDNNNFNILDINKTDQNEINYDQTRQIYTLQHVGLNYKKTVFDIFKFVSVPVILENDQSILVIIEVKTKKLLLFDVNDVVKLNQSDLKRSQILLNIFRFFQLEEKAKLNIKEWDFIRVKTVFSKKHKYLSNIFNAYFIHQFYIQESSFLVDERYMHVFKQKIYELFMRIGLTQNQKGELSDKFINYPL
ncbi:hypothetical protein PPERSA_03961 [Pseudocohnilembus persalinus]|uniref:Uncharacterized protein n=1 Tax=Pseudocohnilembus persalinus TaxID=266149 RepID=A0A0V0QB07_PSEPJ|nr:hypothetical protein PPERSA_03961 [Pseudocohnilembus persalinus]|eukprot:KRW99255.1 hypothetical protein PPERSA_03961 [Pseudocohnilembus persalinus]